MTKEQFKNITKNSPYYIKCNTEQEEQIFNYQLRTKYGCNDFFNLPIQEQITKLRDYILSYSLDLEEYEDSDYFYYFLRDDEQVTLEREEKEVLMSEAKNVKDMFNYYLDLFFTYDYPEEAVKNDTSSYFFNRIFDLQRLHSLLITKNEL